MLSFSGNWLYLFQGTGPKKTEYLTTVLYLINRHSFSVPASHILSSLKRPFKFVLIVIKYVLQNCEGEPFSL